MIKILFVLSLIAIGSPVYGHDLEGSYREYGDSGVNLVIDDHGHITRSTIPYYVDDQPRAITFTTRFREINSDRWQYLASGYFTVSHYYPYFPNVEYCRHRVDLAANLGADGIIDAEIFGPGIVGISGGGQCYDRWSGSRPLEFVPVTP